MKIIITVSSSSLDAEFDPRFGRCAYFLAMDTETMGGEAFPNPGINASGGAGTQAAQFVAEQKAVAVISGDFGPNASSALNAAGILMYLNKADGNIQDIVKRFIAGELQQVSAPTAIGTHHSPGK
jgi:predicted Fe-Mo cluster-binding NifX family protein